KGSPVRVLRAFGAIREEGALAVPCAIARLCPIASARLASIRKWVAITTGATLRAGTTGGRPAAHVVDAVPRLTQALRHAAAACAVRQLRLTLAVPVATKTSETAAPGAARL